MSNQQRLNPEELVLRLAAMANLTEPQVRALLQAQAQLACEQARVDYPVPGIGLLHLADMPARTMVMLFGPKKGQTVEIPAKKRLKFWVCKMIKEVVLGNPVHGQQWQKMPDIFDPNLFDVTWYPPDEEMNND